MFLSLPHLSCLTFRRLPLALALGLLALLARPHASFSATDKVQPGPTFTVTTTADTNDGTCGVANCTLREAINLANAYNQDKGNAGATIAFTPGVTGTITLTSALLPLSSAITVTGPGASALTVDGANAFTVLSVSNGTTTGPVVTISGLTVAHGKAADGGGILNDHSTLTLNNCVLADNTATTIGGGGLFNNGANGGSATATLNNCALSGNTSPQGAGLYNFGYKGSAAVTLNDCTFSNNAATSGSGGGLYNFGNGGSAAATLSNCTFSGNTAPKGAGAGLYNFGGTLALGHCTLSGNAATNGIGGGVFNDGSNAGAAQLTVGNTIFNFGNSSGTSFFNNKGTVTDAGYNLSSDGSGPHNSPTDKVNTDPLLGPLADNGGPTQTMVLLSGSPAINAGDPSLTAAPNSYDGRGPGYARVYGSRPDIGAFEAQPLSQLVVSQTLTSTPSSSGALITATITLTNNGPDTATAVALSGATPFNTTFVALTQTSGPTFTLTKPATGGTGSFTARRPTLLNGATATFSLVLRINEGTPDNSPITDSVTATTATTHPAIAPATGTAGANASLSITITDPPASGFVRGLPLIAGTTFATGGSKGQRVLLFLRRVADGKYFNGTAFSSAQPTPLTTTYNPQTGQWERSAGLPTTTELLLGDYRILAIVIDSTGHRSDTTSSFTVAANGATGSISAASASVAADSVTLRFTVALNAEAASDAGHYSVTVNGKTIAVESASYNASNHSVVLELAPGALKAGTQVVVATSGLSDSAGHPVTGQAGPVTAK